MKITLHNDDIVQAIAEYTINRGMIPNNTECIIKVYTRVRSEIEIDLETLDTPVSDGQNAEA